MHWMAALKFASHFSYDELHHMVFQQNDMLFCFVIIDLQVSVWLRY